MKLRKEPNEIFRRLLQGALDRIKSYSSPLLKGTIEKEIAGYIKRDHSTLLHWEKGYVPGKPKELEMLVREIIRKSDSSIYWPLWLEEILFVAQLPHAKALHNELFPGTANAPFLAPTNAAKSRRKHIFVSYRHNTDLDWIFARQLARAIQSLHDVILDPATLGTADLIKRRISELQQTDAVVFLLSVHSVHSETVIDVVKESCQIALIPNRRLDILPIRLDYWRPLEPPLSAYLDPHRWTLWRNHEDTPRVISEIKSALSGGALPLTKEMLPKILQPPQTDPLAPPKPEAPALQPESPTGTMSADSRFYVERNTDLVALKAIGRNGETITIKGPRQIGKSSLLVRVMQAAKNGGKQVAFLDFQYLDRITLTHADNFFPRFCHWISKRLGKPSRVKEYWDDAISTNVDLCTQYMREYLLPDIGSRITLIMDEVDRVFDTDFRSDFFGMLRGWHNSRVIDEVWRQLDLVLVTSTEPYLLIEQLSQSPFNVGEVIDLEDLTREQVADLNQRHGHPAPLSSMDEDRLFVLLQGHPYLTRKALYQVAEGRYSSADLFNNASDDDGPFGDHLRSLFLRLHQRPEMIETLRQVLQKGKCSSDLAAFRLRGAGLVRSEKETFMPRCQLYADYFRRRLHD